MKNIISHYKQAILYCFMLFLSFSATAQIEVSIHQNAIISGVQLGSAFLEFEPASAVDDEILSISWVGPNGEYLTNGFFVSNISYAGEYCVTIIDVDFCVATECIYVPRCSWAQTSSGLNWLACAYPAPGPGGDVPLAGNEGSEGIDIYNVYPNPFSSSFEIEINNDETELLTLKISDLLGQEIIVERIETFEGQTSISMNLPKALAAGTYVLSIFDAEGNSDQQQIISQ